jgi:ketosteroid isomerase-like protein
MDDSEDYQQVMEAINKWTDSLNQKDFDTFYEIEKESFGYGWRGSGFRDQPIDREKKKQGIMSWLNSMQKYHCYFQPEKIEVIDDTALMCGNFLEEVTEKYGSKKSNKVRTSMAWIKSDGEWKLALYHRDTQFT